MADASTKPKRWFRFSLRAMMVLVVLVSVPLGVWVKRARDQQRVAGLILSVGGNVYYDYQRDENLNPILSSEAPGPPWLRALLGVDYFDNVVEVKIHNNPNATETELEAVYAQLSKLRRLRRLDFHAIPVSETGLASIATLSHLQRISLHACSISDAGLVHVGRIKSLRILNLNYTRVTDRGLAHLEGLGNLQSLSLIKTTISDDGLKHLEPLAQLRDLDLAQTSITDAGLIHLQSLAKLDTFYVNSVPTVSDAGIARLKANIPNLHVAR